MSYDKNLENHNLVRLLRSLADDEWPDYEKFVASAYFSDGRNYIPLLNAIKKHRPDFLSPEFTKEKIHAKLYGKGKYSESAINSMLSRLYRISEDFLVQKEFENGESFYRECLRLRALHLRGLNSKAGKHLEELSDDAGRLKFEENTFLDRKRFRREAARYIYAMNKRSEIPSALMEVLKESVYSFLVEAFANDFSIHTQKNFWNSDYSQSYVAKLLNCIDYERILELVRENDNVNYAFLKICRTMALTMNDFDNDSHYAELRKLIFDNFETFADPFRKTSLNILALICSAKFVKGRKEFKREAFEIRKKIVDEGLFSMSTSKYILLSEFRSTLLEAFNEKEYEWAAKFAEKYLRRLQPEFRDDVRHYCDAMFAFSRKDFDTAVASAGKVNINQIIFKLDMKNLIAKIYYETGSYESLLSHLNTYSQFIKNSASAGKELLQRHKNFVNFLKGILNVILKDKDEAMLSVLRNEISSANVSAKYWLLPRIDELLNND